MIALEAMLAGATDVHVRVVDGWIYVSADVDWLAGVETEAFEGFPRFNPGGPNGVTSEFFLVIFSRSVVTVARSGARAIKGDSLGPLEIPIGAAGRTVAFEIAAAESESA